MAALNRQRLNPLGNESDITKVVALSALVIPSFRVIVIPSYSHSFILSSDNGRVGKKTNKLKQDTS